MTTDHYKTLSVQMMEEFLELYQHVKLSTKYENNINTKETLKKLTVNMKDLIDWVAEREMEIDEIEET